MVVVGMLVGTFRVFSDTTNQARIFFWQMVADLQTQINALLMSFGIGGSDGLLDGIMWLVDALGTGVVGVFGLVIGGVAKVVKAFRFLVATLKGVFYSISNLYSAITTNPSQLLTDPGQLMFDAFDQGARRARDEFVESGREGRVLAFKDGLDTGGDEKNAAEKAANAADETRRESGQGSPNVDITNNIEQNIESDANPDRIALRSADISGRKTRQAIRPLAKGF